MRMEEVSLIFILVVFGRGRNTTTGNEVLRPWRHAKKHQRETTPVVGYDGKG